MSLELKKTYAKLKTKWTKMRRNVGGLKSKWTKMKKQPAASTSSLAYIKAISVLDWDDLPELPGEETFP
jgi:hypothetical protein